MNLVYIYLFCTLISIVELILLIAVYENSHHNIPQAMILVLIAFTNLGYSILIIAKGVDSAILANKIAYVGGVWIPLCVFMTVSRLCDMKFKIHLGGILSVFNLLVFLLAMTQGYSEIFYKTSGIEIHNGITVLHSVYGPTHILFYILLVVEIGLSFFVVFYTRVIKKKSIPVAAIVVTFMPVILPRCVYITRALFHSTFDIMPIAYTVAGTIFLLAYNTISMHDIALLVSDVRDKSDEHGYIAFNMQKKLVSYNKKAAVFFPSLLDIKIDSEIPKGTTLYEDIVSKLQIVDGKDVNLNLHYEIGIKDKYHLKVNLFSSEHSESFGFNKYYLVELVDNTFEHNYISMQRDFNSQLREEVDKQITYIKTIYDSVIESMSVIIANRDNSTGMHVIRTSMVAKLFMEELAKSPRFHFTDEFCKNVERAAPLHDIGKLGVNDSVLLKPGKFTDDEYKTMQAHPSLGARIIEQVFSKIDDDEFKKIAVNIAGYHHEHWDGTGYPLGLKGEDIPIEARIMAFPDVFDALVSDRVYKDSFSYDTAFDIIRDSLGSHFDPELGEVFLSMRDELEELYGHIGDDITLLLQNTLLS